MTTAPAAGMFARLARRRILRIDGPNSAGFLQGLVSNQMARVERGGAAILAAFLNAQGRIMQDVFIYPENKADHTLRPSFLIDCDASTIDSLGAHLRRYRLRSRIGLTRLDSGEADVWQAWGHSAHLLWDSYVEATPSKLVPPGGLILKEGFCTIGCRDPRHPSLGVRFVLENGRMPKLPASFSQVDAREYDIQRILNGIPEGPLDFFPNQSLPLESNLDYMSGVDFRKGCYLGQELTIRTYHTGVTRKRIVPVQLFRDGEPAPETLSIDRSFTEQPPESQSDITSVSNATQSPPSSPQPSSSSEPSTVTPRRSRNTGIVGKFCSGIHNIGLALVRLEHVYSPNTSSKSDATTLATANGLHLRAFAPAWWPKAQPE